MTNGQTQEKAPRSGFARFGVPLLFIAVIGGLLLIFAWDFLQDPSRTAATRDPAWYTWRAGIIVQSNPALVPGDWGPFAMFGGGYRVSVPVMGALLQGVGDTAQDSFPAIMMIMIPILAGLAFGSAAYRSTKSNFLYLLTLLVTGAFYLTTPYVGYLDNLFVLYVLAAVIAFLEPARKSWGARSAVVILSVIAAYTHPTTCVVFLGTMFAVFGFHIVTMRVNVRQVLDRDLPALISVMTGMVSGLILWPLGKLLLWGTAGNLADAALPPPYTRAFFLDRLIEWVKAQYPVIVIPLIVIAIAWIWSETRRTKKPADAYRTMSAWWLLPYMASIVFVAAGKTLPYYRFMNSTAAIMPLTAIGIFALGVWVMKKTNNNKIVAAALLVVLAGGLWYTMSTGLEISRWNDPTNQWIDQDTRVALTSVATIAGADPAHPVVFVNNYRSEIKGKPGEYTTPGDPTAYGWSKTDANVGRAGLPGAVAPRTFQYFGDLDRFLAGEGDLIGQRTITSGGCNDILSAKEVDLTAVTGGKKKDSAGNVVEDAGGNPVKLPPRTDCTYDLVSRGFLDEMRKGVDENGGSPYVFLVKKFNTPSPNTEYFDAANDLNPGDVLTTTSVDGIDGATITKIGPGLLMVTGTGFSTPSDATLQSAIRAGQAKQSYLDNHPGPFADPLHLLRVLLGLFFIVALPGLLSTRWFEVEGWRMKLGLVPAISIALNILVAIAFISVTRSSFTSAHAWMSVGIAAVIAVGLNLAARRRGKSGPVERTGSSITELVTKVGEMIDAMSVPFKEHRSFRSLMLTQFVSMAGDGVVAGTIFASVTNPNDAKSGADLMALVFLTYMPFALLAPFVGAVADRFDRRRLLIFVNFARAVLMALAVITFLAGVDSVALLSAMSLLVLAGFRVTLLVKGAGLPDSVGGKDLLLANSLSQAGGTIFQAAGAVFGFGISKVFADLNIGYVAAVSIAMYVFAGMFARGIKRLESGAPNESFGKALSGVVRSVIDGVKEVAQRPAAAVGILSFWFTRTLVFGFIGLSLAFALLETVTGSKSGGSTQQIISLLFAGLGAGIGLFYAQHAEDKVAPARIITTFMFVAGGSAVLVPFTVFGRYLATFVAGLAFFLVKVAADTVAQSALPDDFRGRAYSLFDITYALSYAIPAGTLFLASKAGVDLDWVVAGFGVVVVLMGAWLGGWSRRLGLYAHASDDLVGAELVTGIEDLPPHPDGPTDVT